MKTFFLTTVALACLCNYVGARTATHNATAYCTRLSQTNQLQFEFRLVLNDDPVGTVLARDSSGTNVPNSQCTIAYDTTTKVYSFTSIVNLATNQAALNGCGYSVSFGGQQFTWRVAYYELPAMQDVTLGKNRVYTTNCNVANLTTDQRDSPITVNAPNIDETLTSTVPPINLYVLYQTQSGTYTYVTPSTPSLPADTLIRLQLEVAFGTFSQSSIYGVGGLLTQSAGRGDFSDAQQFFNARGCPANTLTAPNTAYGFLGPAVGSPAVSPFIATTAPFRLFVPDTSTNLLYFRVYFETCIANTYNLDSFCRDPCQNPRSRRRRQADDVEETIAVAYVKIANPSNGDDVNQQERRTSSDTTMLYVGVGVAGVMLVVLVGIVACFLVLRSRRRRSEEKSAKVPSEGFVNQVQY